MAALGLWSSPRPGSPRASPRGDPDGADLRAAAAAVEGRLTRLLAAEREERASALGSIWRSLERQQVALADLAAPGAGAQSSDLAARERRELLAAVAALHGDVEAVRSNVKVALDEGMAPKSQVERLEAQVEDLRVSIVSDEAFSCREAALRDAIEELRGDVRGVEASVAKHRAQAEVERAQLAERLAAVEQRQRQGGEAAADEAAQREALSHDIQRLLGRSRGEEEVAASCLASLRQELSSLREELHAELRSRSLAAGAELEALRRGEVPELVRAALTPELRRFEEEVRRERHLAVEEAMEAERERLSLALMEARDAFAKLVDVGVATEARRLGDHLAADVLRLQQRLDGEAERVARVAEDAAASASGAAESTAKAAGTAQAAAAAAEAARAAAAPVQQLRRDLVAVEARLGRAEEELLAVPMRATTDLEAAKAALSRDVAAAAEAARAAAEPVPQLRRDLTAVEARLGRAEEELVALPLRAASDLEAAKAELSGDVAATARALQALRGDAAAAARRLEASERAAAAETEKRQELAAVLSALPGRLDAGLAELTAADGDVRRDVARALAGEQRQRRDGHTRVLQALRAMHGERGEDVAAALAALEGAAAAEQGALEAEEWSKGGSSPTGRSLLSYFFGLS